MLIEGVPTDSDEYQLITTYVPEKVWTLLCQIHKNDALSSVVDFVSQAYTQHLYESDASGRSQGTREFVEPFCLSQGCCHCNT